MKKKVLFWIFAILSAAWLAFIISRSLKPAEASDMESGRLLEFVHKLLPFMTMKLIRKIAHFVEFGILGALMCGAMLNYRKKRNWLTVLLLCLLSALGDETVQLFVEGRSSQVSDVWLDFFGALTSLLLVVLFAFIHKKRKEKKQTQAERAEQAAAKE